MADLPLYLTAPEAAQVLRVKADRLRGWIERGELPAANLGDKTRPRYRISRSDLLLFLEWRAAAKLCRGHAATPRCVAGCDQEEPVYDGWYQQMVVFEILRR